MRRVTAPSFSDDFDGPDLDREVWVAHYLPQWSSRAETAATYELDGSELRLTIAPDQGVWCAGDHEPPLRVSGVQSGVWSGPVGGTAGQQPYRDGLVVREAQPAQWGWTPLYGLVEVRARMELGRGSMAAAWLAGVEDEPRRSGEICLFEVFGDALAAGDGGPTAAVGVGVHPFRDPALTDDFAAERLAIDVREPHVYAADWRPGRVEFLVDGRVVRSVAQAPDYPMQIMVAVYDFPERAPAGPLPLLAVDRVAGPASARW
jgi:Glycosyl hydrolases family 16